ncbi:MAG TPA: hypothetical protein PKA88_34965 [Polyangiaceae bacterium]|nr:hypothetical protein [Polyangiaceae bacterium]
MGRSSRGQALPVGRLSIRRFENARARAAASATHTNATLGKFTQRGFGNAQHARPLANGVP